MKQNDVKPEVEAFDPSLIFRTAAMQKEGPIQGKLHARKLYVYTVARWTALKSNWCALAATRTSSASVVQRKPHPSLVTDFVACVGCKTVYWAPLRQPDPMPARPGDDMKAIGGPQPDSTAALKRDAAEAAKDYRKPGRSGRR